MTKKIIAIAVSLLMLAGCASANTNTAEQTTLSETTAGSVEEIQEEVEEEIEYVDEDFWTDEEIQAQLGSEYDLSSFTCSGYYERGDAKLISYVENNDNPLSLVIHCKADETLEILYAQQGPMGLYAKAFEPMNFPDYQNIDHTIYIIDSLPMGNGAPIINWHLSADGTVIDLADTIDFETQFEGLFIGDIGEGENCETVIGLREQIPGTVAVGASMVVPVTLDENEKIVKVDASLYSAENVHEWENIDYYSEPDIPESGHTYGEEIPFYDYALNVIGDAAVVDYFIENSEIFQEFMSYTSYYGYVGRINGDFDKDGEQEYLIATNYGHAYVNNIAIIDGGEVVYWADKDTSMNYFYKVRVGEYLKADPERLTNGVLEDYINYTFTDYTVNDDNMFIGVRSNQREAYNYYYQIIYDEAEGYSIKPIKRIGWETRQFEGDDGPVVVREFSEEAF